MSQAKNGLLVQGLVEKVETLLLDPSKASQLEMYLVVLVTCAQVNHSVTVLTADMAQQAIVDQLSTFTSAVNNAQISYNPLIRNSNSFAYQAVEVLTGTRPPTQAWAPGAQTVLRVH